MSDRPRAGETGQVPPPPDGPAPQRDEPRPVAHGTVPWSVWDAVGVLALTALLTVVAIVAIGLLTALRLVPEVLSPLILPLPLVLLAVVTVVWAQVRFGAAGRLFGPGRGRASEWLLGVGVGIGAFLAVNIGLTLLLQALAALFGFEVPQPQEGAREAAADPELLAWLILAAVVVAPIAEEVFFRGMLYQALRRRMRAWGAIWLSAIVFAAAHILQELGGPAGPVAFVLILPLGVLLGWLFERRGNLAAPIAVHATFNLITTAFLVAGFAG